MLARLLREADPVINCSPQGIRWEGFSACCSAYARLDLLPPALDGALLGYGTTNVDLGPQARAGLARLRDQSCHIEVGSQALELQIEGRPIIERRVPLPVRWLKGLVEVQSLMAEMRQLLEVSAAEARRFLQSLPKGPSRRAGWVVGSGRGLRFSQLASPEGVQLSGWQRLAVLQDLLRHALHLRVYAHPGGSSGWELVCPDSHFFLILSPEVWRGFSGEGQLLHRLAVAFKPSRGGPRPKCDRARDAFVPRLSSRYNHVAPGPLCPRRSSLCRVSPGPPEDFLKKSSLRFRAAVRPP